MSSSLRNNRLACACFGVVQEHHEAVVLLLKSDLNGSAFALLRSQYESCIRGLWLAYCATDQQLDRFAKGAEPPKFGELLANIESAPAFNQNLLSQIKAHSWSSMCAYTHTGSLQVQRWNTPDAIEPNYSDAEIAEVEKFANACALLSASGIASLVNDETLPKKILEKAQEYST